ncbi:hypothetical protein DPMN_027853 [Dreissena polymorpha]|uniref:Uncharacterized protein n=1 Tax=Dreissena polymorpha TaxID=45954 RepID=A0A9D4RFX1_DREPO|nr:hypothetical protein DPMN_027853 [Dreissena polymorpha]
MDTQRGRWDTGLGGQQTTFNPLDAQRDQADTRMDIQQTTFHPDAAPPTLENRNTHALHNPVDTIHVTECEECDGASCDQIRWSCVRRQRRIHLLQLWVHLLPRRRQL